MNYIIYNLATGEILRNVDCPESMLDIQVAAGEDSLVGQADDATRYVQGGQAVDRPAMSLIVGATAITADGVDEATISGIPEGAECEGLTIEADGLFIFTTDDPGDHVLTFRLFPYLDAEVTIHAS